MKRFFFFTLIMIMVIFAYGTSSAEMKMRGMDMGNPRGGGGSPIIGPLEPGIATEIKDIMTSLVSDLDVLNSMIEENMDGSKTSGIAGFYKEISGYLNDVYDLMQKGDTMGANLISFKQNISDMERRLQTFQMMHR